VDIAGLFCLEQETLINDGIAQGRKVPGFDEEVVAVPARLFADMRYQPWSASSVKASSKT